MQKHLTDLGRTMEPSILAGVAALSSSTVSMMLLPLKHSPFLSFSKVFACNVTLFQQLIPAAAAVEFPARVHCPFPKLSVNSSAIKTTLNYKSLRGDKKSKSRKGLPIAPTGPSLGHRGDWVQRRTHLC